MPKKASKSIKEFFNIFRNVNFHKKRNESLNIKIDEIVNTKYDFYRISFENLYKYALLKEKLAKMFDKDPDSTDIGDLLNGLLELLGKKVENFIKSMGDEDIILKLLALDLAYDFHMMDLTSIKHILNNLSKSENSEITENIFNCGYYLNVKYKILDEFNKKDLKIIDIDVYFEKDKIHHVSMYLKGLITFAKKLIKIEKMYEAKLLLNKINIVIDGISKNADTLVFQNEDLGNLYYLMDVILDYIDLIFYFENKTKQKLSKEIKFNEISKIYEDIAKRYLKDYTPLSEFNFDRVYYRSIIDLRLLPLKVGRVSEVLSNLLDKMKQFGVIVEGENNGENVGNGLLYSNPRHTLKGLRLLKTAAEYFNTKDWKFTEAKLFASHALYKKIRERIFRKSNAFTLSIVLMAAFVATTILFMKGFLEIPTVVEIVIDAVLIQAIISLIVYMMQPTKTLEEIKKMLEEYKI